MRLWDDAGAIRRLSTWLYTLAAIALFAAVIVFVVYSSLFPVRKVQIDGKLSQVSHAQLQYIAEHGITGNLFTVDVHQIKQSFEQLPWVKKAEVRRFWPDKLEITVVERQALARWDKNGLIDADGVWFDGNTDEVLPTFEGGQGTELQMATMYNKLKPIFAKVNLTIDSLQLAERGAWQVKLDNGVLLKFGRKDVLKRAEVLALFWSSQLEAQQSNIEYIDLRYSNGFVLKAKTQISSESLN
jgi:cell division protein FtsQ